MLLGPYDLLYLVICAGLMFCSYFVVRLHEYITTRRAYNKGVCPKCGRKLRFDMCNGSGDRLYKCDLCFHFVWIKCSSTIDIEKIK